MHRVRSLFELGSRRAGRHRIPWLLLVAATSLALAGCATFRAKRALVEGRPRRALAILDEAKASAPLLRARAHLALGEAGRAYRIALLEFRRRPDPETAILASRAAWQAGLRLSALAAAEDGAAAGLLSNRSERWVRRLRTWSVLSLLKARRPAAALFGLRQWHLRLPEKRLQELAERALAELADGGRLRLAARLLDRLSGAGSARKKLARLRSCLNRPQIEGCPRLLGRLCRQELRWAAGRLAAAPSSHQQRGIPRELAACGLRLARAARDGRAVAVLEPIVSEGANIEGLFRNCLQAPTWHEPSCSRLATRVISRPTPRGCRFLARAARRHGWHDLRTANRLAAALVCPSGEWRDLLPAETPVRAGLHPLVAAELLRRAGKLARATAVWNRLLDEHRREPAWRLELARAALDMSQPDLALVHVHWAHGLLLPKGLTPWARDLARRAERRKAGRKGYVRTWIRRLVAEPGRLDDALGWVLSAAGPPVAWAILAGLERTGRFQPQRLASWRARAEQALASWLGKLEPRDRKAAPGDPSAWWAGFGADAAKGLAVLGTRATRHIRVRTAPCGLGKLSQAASRSAWAEVARRLLQVPSGCRLLPGERLAWAAGLLAISGHLDEARHLLLQRAEASGPADPRALALLAHLPPTEAGVALAWRAARTLPFATGLLRGSIRILLAAKHWPRARLASESLAAHAQDPVEATAFLVRAWQAAGRCEEAGDWLSRLWEWTAGSLPLDLEALAARHFARCRQSVLRDVLRRLEGVGSLRRRFLWSLALVREGRQEEALAAAGTAPSLRFRVLVAARAWEEAAQAALQWLLLRPGEAGPACGLARMARKRHHWWEAEALLDAAWLLEPQNPCILEGRIGLALARGRRRAARRWAALARGRRAWKWLWRLSWDRETNWQERGRLLAGMAAADPELALRLLWSRVRTQEARQR